ncbi:MAG: DUF5685 family protein [Firmicutes bacterium]|nr:DUF5685 family protein [Bacillota bacterium]MCM1393347.1 DUF5685 family protein [[Eubacterium] siraeum]
MFGYVIPDKNNMYIKDFNVFQAFYCGLCKALHKTGSEVTRLCTNYDITFYNVLIHCLAGSEVKFERKLCVYNGKKKVIVVPDEISLKMADLAAMLVYYNAEDDVHDGKKSRALIKWRLALRKRKAAKRLPKIDALMKDSFKRLNALEKENCDSIDRVADCFASLMRDITRELVKTDSDIDDFTYNLGRMVYLLDAVDDVEKDCKKHRYNPLLLNYGECENKREYLEKNKDELAFLLNSTYNKMVGSYNRMNIVLYEGVLSNTVYLGIKMQMERLLKGDEKCQVTRL